MKTTVLGAALLLPLCMLSCGGSDDENDNSSGGSASGGSAGSSSGGTFNLGGAGNSGGTASGGTSSGGSGGNNCGQVLVGTIRDFNSAPGPNAHPDFEYTLGDDRGIVTNQLGADFKPVYAGSPNTPTTNGKAAFDQWFRDTPNVNQAIPYSITLTDAGNGNYVYDNGDFFPIDDQGLGNQGRNHNFHFTYEIHTKFEYRGGEVFTFRGDDDLFTYINGALAINLGGVHGAQQTDVDLDARASEFGISVGKSYNLDFFFAERHTTQSNFRIETSIGCFTPQIPE